MSGHGVFLLSYGPGVYTSFSLSLYSVLYVCPQHLPVPHIVENAAHMSQWPLKYR